MAIPLAFYAPLKSPDHPAPSGDRTMARLLIRALQAAGFAPELASTLRTLDKAGDPAVQEALRRESLIEADALVARWRAASSAARPRLWFTYHCYYKAPDWIGPRIADALGIPYVVAEGTRAGKRAHGPWALGHAGAEAALDRADIAFALTAADRESLARHKPPRQTLLDLPPFLDLEGWGDPSPRLRGEGRSTLAGAEASPKGEGEGGSTGPLDSERPPHPRSADASLASHPGKGVLSPLPAGGERGLSSGEAEAPIRLLTVAMMREGDKLASYRLLAAALARLPDALWRLDIVGDGPARPDVEALFAPLGGRVRLLGQVEDRARLGAIYAGADLLVWPAVNEAYGMVLLEAQAQGCPVLAGAYGGVASVVRDRETGLLAPPGDTEAFAAALLTLIGDAALRARLSMGAHRFVREERTLLRAAARLQAALTPLLDRRGAA